MPLTSEPKFLVPLIRPCIHLQTLTPLVTGTIQPYFSHLLSQTSIYNFKIPHQNSTSKKNFKPQFQNSTSKIIFKIQLHALTSNLKYKPQLQAPALAELGPAQPQLVQIILDIQVFLQRKNELKVDVHILYLQIKITKMCYCNIVLYRFIVS